MPPLKPLTPVDPTPPGRAFDDVPALRTSLYDLTKNNIASVQPISMGGMTLALTDVDYADPGEVTPNERKKAILRNESLTRRLRGTLTLTDDATQQPISTKTVTIARLPKPTDDGTMVLNGVEWTLGNQLRLRPGMYVRQTKAGDVETHVNAQQGTGPIHHFGIDPKSGVFKIRVGQSHMPLAPLLAKMGATQKDLEAAWGPELAKSNLAAKDTGVMKKLYDKVFKNRKGAPPANPEQATLEALQNIRFDPAVNESTLGMATDKLDVPTILAATKKMLAVRKGEAEADDRDDLSYQALHGPEDLVSERARQLPKAMRGILYKALRRRNLDNVPADFFGGALRAAITESGLGQAAEETNPSELLGQLTRVSRLGVGGIASAGVAPDESKNVHPSQYGFIDPDYSPECYDAETEVLTIRGWVKWPEVTDGELFACMISDQIEYHRADRIVRQEYSGKMYAPLGSVIDFLVTPNHDLYISTNTRVLWHKIKVEEMYAREIGAFVIPAGERFPFDLENVKDLIAIEQYEGMVYCATVPGGLLYVRRNGCPGFWCGNSEKAGLDMRLSGVVRKGQNGDIYTRVRNRKTGQIEWKTPRELAKATRAFAQEDMTTPGEMVRSLVRNRLDLISNDQVDYETPYAEDAYNPLLQLLPLKGGAKGQRLSMGARMQTQAVPPVENETPLVQSADPEDEMGSMEKRYGSRLGAIRSKLGGRVTDVTPDSITVVDQDGNETRTELAQHTPYNRKTYLSQTAVVKPGQEIKPGDMLARSNYTDADGRAALGRNLRTAFMPAKGYSFEDAFVISRSAAKKMTSSHMYQTTTDFDHTVKNNKNAFISLFPSQYKREILDNLDDDGIVKVGTKVQKGDPLILRARQAERAQNKILRNKFGGFRDQSETWDKEDEGTVTDVERTNKGVVVAVKADHPMNEGDKLVLRFGSKGLIGKVVDDEEMPTDQDGQPFEALVNPLTVITRRNPNQVVETVLGKIAAKTGKPYSVPSFSHEADPNSAMIDFAKREAAKHGVSDKEDVIDPVTGRTIPGVLTGVSYFMKLHHLAESKQSGRGFGSYGADDAPAKIGGAIGSAKKFSLADAQAALAHGAHNFVRDTKMIRSQRNQDYWSEFMAGKSPLEPRVSAHHERFLNLLRAGGLNPVKQGEKLKLGVLTDKDVLERAGDREIQNGDTVNWDEGLSPVKGGLFDPGLTGGHGSKNQWAKITLSEPVPNPGFEDPIRWTLGITEKKMREVLAGRDDLNGKKGPTALFDALNELDIDKEIERTKVQWKARRGVGKDQAARRWSTLARAKEQGLHPRDWMMTVVPVLPPAFRPVSVMQDTGRPMVADANLLYKDLLDTSKALKELVNHTSDVGDERLAVYDAVKAVTGLGEPVSPKNRERGVKGVLKTVFGNAGPKYSAIQKSLLGGTVDTVGQGVVVPDPELGMDEVGIPEDLAWETYRPFVVRRLVRSNIPGPKAYQMVEDRDDRAKNALLQEMDSRPVVMRRAPVLHKYGEMGFRPKLVRGKQIRVTPVVTTGFGMDFDGDSVAFHVPSTDASVRDVIERMLPSKNLLAVRTGKVHQLPKNEFATGLYQATANRSDSPVRIFATEADAERAYQAGKINHDQVVRILENR